MRKEISGILWPQTGRADTGDAIRPGRRGGTSLHGAARRYRRDMADGSLGSGSRAMAARNLPAVRDGISW